MISLINNEAHKRLQYPDHRDFDLSIGEDFCGYNRVFIQSKSGRNIHFFKTRQEAEDNLSLLRLFAKNLRISLENKVRAHKKEFPQYYVETYEEANFVHKAIYKGFKSIDAPISPYFNWFGCSRYAPDQRLKRGDKKIILSLQGMGMPPPKEFTPQWQEVAKEKALKYLGFYNGDAVEYETYYGNLPDKEFIEEFIK